MIEYIECMPAEYHRQRVVAGGEEADVAVLHPDFPALDQDARRQRAHEAPGRGQRFAQCRIDGDVQHATEDCQDDPGRQAELIAEQVFDSSDHEQRPSGYIFAGGNVA